MRSTASTAATGRWRVRTPADGCTARGTLPTVDREAYWQETKPIAMRPGLTGAVLPAPLRAAFGLRYRWRERAFFVIVTAVIRLMRAVLPSWLTVVPQARRFEAAARRSR